MRRRRELKGIGVLIVIFSICLFGSVLTYMSVAIGRMMALNIAVREADYGRAPNYLLILAIIGVTGAGMPCRRACVHRHPLRLPVKLC